jgi:hypothetical protein
MTRPRLGDGPRKKKADAEAPPAPVLEPEPVEEFAPPARRVEPPPPPPRRPEPTWQEKLATKKEIGRRRQDRRLRRTRGR